jgi:hypothetical protein
VTSILLRGQGLACLEDCGNQATGGTCCGSNSETVSECGICETVSGMNASRGTLGWFGLDGLNLGRRLRRLPTCSRNYNADTCLLLRRKELLKKWGENRPAIWHHSSAKYSVYDPLRSALPTSIMAKHGLGSNSGLYPLPPIPFPERGLAGRLKGIWKTARYKQNVRTFRVKQPFGFR